MIAVEDPSNPTQRLTLTLKVLNRDRTAYFLVSGEEKNKVVGEIFEDPVHAAHVYPAAMVNPEGSLIWFLDRAAYGRQE